MDGFLTGAFIVITFTMLVKWVEEWRAERRWWKQYKERDGGPHHSEYGPDEGYQYYEDRRRWESRR